MICDQINIIFQHIHPCSSHTFIRSVLLSVCIYIYIYIYEDRLGKFKKKDAYILFKDHKPNFKNKLQSRLINPSKTELGKVSKNIIQNIVTNVKKAYYSNLWKNSYDNIEWFRKIKNKSQATFMQFNIIDFYPSITKNTLIDSINYASKYVEITEEQYDIILACRKTVLKNIRSIWIKSGSDNFDVPMGRGVMILYK